MTERYGRMCGRHHYYPVTVFYDHTDAGGIVYHTNYLVFAERARTALLRVHGLSNRDLAERHNVAIAVRHCEAEFMRPARLEDELEVETRVLAVGGATLNLEQTITRGTEVLVRLKLRLACIALGSGRAARLPAEAAAVFAQVVEAQEN